MKIFIAGDSTASIKEANKRPETGWGEKIDVFFTNDITLVNTAINGRSTKTFINENRLDMIANQLEEGDYLFIQFGHNDSKIEDPNRYTNYHDYKENLKKFINVAQSKKAIPVILSSVSRRDFLEDKKTINPLAIDLYPEKAYEVASQMGVCYLDIFNMSKKLYEYLGFEISNKLFVKLLPNESINYPDGIDDNTHLNDFGASVIANLIASSILNSNLDLKKYLNKKELLTFKDIKKRAI